MFHNSYLKVLIPTGLILALSFPSRVVVPSFFSNFSSESGVRADIDRFQIFIKLTSGKTILVWVHGFESVETQKTDLERREGIPRTSFFFLHEGKSLQEESRLTNYQISKNSTIFLMHFLRGGIEGNRGPFGPSSYKEVAQPKVPLTIGFYSPQNSPYFVEKMESTPTLEIKNPLVTKLFNMLQYVSVICHFNGFCPKYFDLNQWVYTNWTTNCQILLFSKGFFVV